MLGWWSPEKELRHRIQQRGGAVNCHAHLDRGLTCTYEIYQEMGDASLPQKWEFIDQLKRTAHYRDTLRERMEMQLNSMYRQGCRYMRTYIDADSTIGMLAIEAALAIKARWEPYGFFLQIAASPVKGIKNPEDRAIFLEACRLVDVVGGLPSRERSGVRDAASSLYGMYEIFEIAATENKPLDMQIGQANDPYEVEEWLLPRVADDFRREGYRQPVTAVHCISCGAWPNDMMRLRTFERFCELDISVVVCPGAAISMRQDRSVVAPTHNSIAPVVELLEAGVNVAFGVDNVEDIYMPFTTGDIMAEVYKMLDAIRWHGPLDPIVDIMTVNGHKALGF